MIQSSAVHHYFQTLTATRPGVISVQSAVRAALPSSALPDSAIGPYYQENFASLLQDPSPVFTTPAWYSSLPATLRPAFDAYMADALALEKAAIQKVVTGTDQLSSANASSLFSFSTPSSVTIPVGDATATPETGSSMVSTTPAASASEPTSAVAASSSAAASASASQTASSGASRNHWTSLATLAGIASAWFLVALL